jgi:DnaJ-class molecular chaperone
MISPFLILELHESAKVDDVKAAWRRLRSIHHPDHGGSREKFDEIHSAYTRAVEIAKQNQDLLNTCPQCNGAKRYTKTRGIHSVTLDCGLCFGTGKAL